MKKAAVVSLACLCLVGCLGPGPFENDSWFLSIEDDDHAGEVALKVVGDVGLVAVYAAGWILFAIGYVIVDALVDDAVEHATHHHARHCD